MPEHPTPHSAPGISLGDIYYVLFRHKWKIILISTIGLVAALLLPLVWRLPYQSEAKLFIKYVLESKTPSQVSASDARVKSPDDRGENIINSELEILTSLDLAQQVAISVGPELILAKAGGGADPQRAAGLIHRNLVPGVAKKSSVVRIDFQHPDPTVVQPVLSSVIETYLKRHAEIHRAASELDEFLTKELDQLKASLKDTDDKLRKAKADAGVLFLDDTKKAFSEQMAKTQQAIFEAEAELAERQAAAGELSKLLNPKPASATDEISAATPTLSPTNAVGRGPVPKGLAGGTNLQLTTFNSQLTSNTPPRQPALTNAVVALSSNTPAFASSNTPALQLSSSGPVPPDKVAEYKKLTSLLEVLNKREQDLSVYLTPENSRVKSAQAQIAVAEKLKKQLEDENPGLLLVKTPETKSSPTGPAGPAGPNVDPRTDFRNELSRVAGLQSRIRTLTNQLATIRNRAASVDAMEGYINELQRKKELDEANYKYFSASKAQAGIDKDLGALRDSNISKIQLPSPPFRDSSKMLKAQAGLLFGGIAGALALAFLLELYFDRSLKRPGEIERTLGIPLFLSIPRMSLNGNGKARFLKAVPKVPLLAQTNSDHGTRNTEQAPGIQHPAINSQLSTINSADPLHTLHSSLPLRPFFETLRDRLIAYFELKNLTHKPKLVAVTSCGEGAGVSTAAAGLAASLSETGEGNVLLVDMNQQHGAAHHFYKGALECGLDDALEVGKRDSALVQDKLYVVTESTTNGDQLPRVLPKRFKHLVPKLRASDYDYIIFDMPPVSQISATPRLARFMDMVFLVVESEKTDRDVVKRASGLLAESKCNLGVILNKSRTYVPKLLQQEL